MRRKLCCVFLLLSPIFPALKHCAFAILILMSENMRRLEDECPENTNFCRGARAGANKVVFEQEKSCLEDTTDECTELGEAAAQEIAFEFCPFDTSASFAPPSRPDYKEACREVASGICEGAVGNQVNNNGCSLTTSELLMLQDKCEYQVNLMTGGDNGGWIEPLPEPVPFSPPGNW